MSLWWVIRLCDGGLVDLSLSNVEARNRCSTSTGILASGNSRLRRMRAQVEPMSNLLREILRTTFGPEDHTGERSHLVGGPLSTLEMLHSAFFNLLFSSSLTVLAPPW